MVKNMPARQKLQETQGQEDPLEKGMATHSSILAWRIPWTGHGITKSWTQLKRLGTHACTLYTVFPSSNILKFYITIMLLTLISSTHSDFPRKFFSEI